MILNKIICSVLAITLSIFVNGAYTASAGGNRILVVLDSNDQETTGFSKLIGGLKSRDFDVSIHLAKDPLPSLIANQDLVYDHVAVLSSKVSSFGGTFKAGNLVEFVNKGGNVLLATDASYTDPIPEFSIEFGVVFEQRGTAVTDYFNRVGNETDLIASKSLYPKAKHVLNLEKKGSVLFRGLPHRLTGKNPLAFPVLTGTPTTFAKRADSKTSPLKGTSLALISAFQSRNNSRVLFSGSLDLFSDDFANFKGDFSNGYAAEEITKWVFHEKSVLRLTQPIHHKVNETEPRSIYRIKDDIVVAFKLEQWSGKKWESFKADDVQVEALMLDPYIRNFATYKNGIYEARFKLPDQYGVFTLKTQYTRHGLSFVEYADTVQVRPFRHDQYPRYLTVAWPYYTNLFSMMVAFFLLSVVFLYNKDTGVLGKSKIKTN